MIASMFNLDHRLAELRPTEQEQRLARELRRAANPATRPARSIGEPARSWPVAAAIAGEASRLATA